MKTQTLADVKATIAKTARHNRDSAKAMAAAIVALGHCTPEARDWCREYAGDMADRYTGKES